MSIKSQKANMMQIHSLISQDLSYIHGEKESGPNGAKKLFLSRSAAFLRTLGKDLGFSDMKVFTNPAGIAVSGEVTLYGMWSKGNGISLEITQPFARSFSFLYRSIFHIKDYRGGANMWLPCSLFNEGNYEKVLRILMAVRDSHAAEQTEADNHVA